MRNTIILVVAILAIAGMQVNAMRMGHDGTILTLSIAAIAAIVGAKFKDFWPKGPKAA